MNKSRRLPRSQSTRAIVWRSPRHAVPLWRSGARRPHDTAPAPGGMLGTAPMGARPHCYLAPRAGRGSHAIPSARSARHAMPCGWSLGGTPSGARRRLPETLGNPGVSGRRPRPQCQKTQGFRGFAADRPIRSGRLTLQRPPVAMSIWQNRFGSFGLAVSVWQSAARPLWHFGFGTLRSI